MADKLGLGTEVRQLKLGQSFSNPRSTGFHTIRYDFKPASVDINKMAAVDVGNNNQVTVTVPHLDGAGIPQTLFKGPQRPYQKECVLIIDRVTGEITLEKLSSNIQVKKTRAETHKASGSSRSADVDPSPPITQRTSSKTKVTSGSRRNPTGLIPKHSPLHASPSHQPSPSHGPTPTLTPTPSVPKLTEPVNSSTLASLPIIGLDDMVEPTPSKSPPPPKSPELHNDEEANGGAGVLSESSSSSSSDSGSSDSDSELDDSQNITVAPIRNGNSANKSPTISVPDHLLNEDLCLSESATDSD